MRKKRPLAPNKLRSSDVASVIMLVIDHPPEDFVSSYAHRLQAQSIEARGPADFDRAFSDMTMAHAVESAAGDTRRP
jgi:hypothetical protein